MSPPTEATPIYMLVRDIQRAQSERNSSLREVTNQHWSSLSASQRSIIEQLARSTATAAQDQHELCQVQRLFGDSPLDAVFAIASTNVYVYSAAKPNTATATATATTIIPAELGLTLVSLRNGVLDSFDALIAPPKRLSAAHQQRATVATAECHGIRWDNNNDAAAVAPAIDYTDLTTVVTSTHALLFRTTGSAAAATDGPMLFIEDDQFEQTVAVLEWVIDQSAQLKLDLDWSPLTTVRLTTAWTALKIRLSMELDWNDDDKSVGVDGDGSDSTEQCVYYQDKDAFKLGLFRNCALCPYHSALESTHWHCALSAAHAHAYVLCRRFLPQFDLCPVDGVHVPLSIKKWFR